MNFSGRSNAAGAPWTASIICGSTSAAQAWVNRARTSGDRWEFTCSTKVTRKPAMI